MDYSPFFLNHFATIWRNGVNCPAGIKHDPRCPCMLEGRSLCLVMLINKVRLTTSAVGPKLDHTHGLLYCAKHVKIVCMHIHASSVINQKGMCPSVYVSAHARVLTYTAKY